MRIKRERKRREKGKMTRKKKIEKGTKRPSSTCQTTRLVCKSESFRISN